MSKTLQVLVQNLSIKGICVKTINRKEPNGLKLECKDILDIGTCAVALKQVRLVV